jgi:hypothetical protein
MEPDPSLHHIFTDASYAQMLYDALMQDQSLTDEQREAIEPPRQSHGWTWIVDKVRD